MDTGASTMIKLPPWPIKKAPDGSHAPAGAPPLPQPAQDLPKPPTAPVSDVGVV
jgi:hypothetical protein